ncbi:MAG: hypothetical protein H6Q72_480 [Firmicutes bacterium]|nr:hypothetical protein [Bacillota bacterium]
MSIRKTSRAALLLALVIVFQSLRLYLPIPPFVSVYLIGSLVNACLLLSVLVAGWRAALALSVVAPVVAYLQQVLLLPVLILPVAAANIAYVGGYLMFAGKNTILAISTATTAKFLIIYLMVTSLIHYIGITGTTATALTLLLGWPQLITGFAGGAVFLSVSKRLFKLRGGHQQNDK